MSTIASSDALSAVITATVACTYVPLLLGSWKFMVRLRTVSSRVMFGCLAVLPFWILSSRFLLGGMSRVENLTQVVSWGTTAITCAMFVTPAVAFFFVARRIGKAS